MNRQIKFRAWDKKLSRFIKVSHLPDDGFNHFKDNPESTENHHLMDLESGISHYLTLSGRFVGLTPESPWRTGIRDESERYILQQFTGLLDKNDIEIYEGDLIGFDGVYGEVLWFNSGWQVGDGGMLHVIVDKCDVTVLGNIFQNPKQHE